MKKLLPLLMLILSLTACQACGPAELKTPDASTEVQDPYPWAVWEECSNTEGSNPCNFTLADQNGVEVSLYDFYGSPIILDLSAMWCGPCNSAAVDLQSTVEDYSNHDLRYVTVIIDNEYGDPPSQQDLERWADSYGISEPVLGGSRDVINSDPSLGWPIGGWPTFIGITADMEVHLIMQGFSTSLIEHLADETISASQ